MPEPPGGFNSQSCAHGASSNSSLQVRFPYSSSDSCRGFRLWVPTRQRPPVLCLCCILGRCCTLDLPFSYGFKKSCWFFSLLSFLLVQTECGLLSSLCTELEIRNLIFFSTKWYTGSLKLQPKRTCWNITVVLTALAFRKARPGKGDARLWSRGAESIPARPAGAALRHPVAGGRWQENYLC